MIRFVRVDPESKRYEKTILAEMQPLVGKPLDLDAVAARITELYGLGYFETLDYSVVTQGEGADEESGLEVRARRKSWGPTYVRFGLNLQDRIFRADTQYNAAARFLDDRDRRSGRGAVDGRADRQRSEDNQRVLSAARCAANLVRGAEPCASRRRDLPIYVNNLANRRFSRSRGRRATSISAATSATGARSASGFTGSTAGTTTAAAIRTSSTRSTTTASISSSSATTSSTTCTSRAKDRRSPAMGRQSHQFGRRHRLRSGDGRLADRRFARAQHAAVVDLGRRRPWTAGSIRRMCRISIRWAVFSIYRVSRPNRCWDPTSRSPARFTFARSAAAARASSSFPPISAHRSRSAIPGANRSDISLGSAHKDASVFVAFDTFLGPVYLGSGYDPNGQRRLLSIPGPDLLSGPGAARSRS